MLTGDSLRAASHASPPFIAPQTPGTRFAYCPMQGRMYGGGFEGRAGRWLGGGSDEYNRVLQIAQPFCCKSA